MIQLITKRDLPDYTKFSVNTADLLINPSIQDAHVFNVLPHLSLPEQRALSAYLANADRASFEADYKACEKLGFPEEQLAGLVANPLYSVGVLYLSAVRPLLCYETYRHLLLGHGVHVTPNGVEVVEGTDGTPVSGQQRTEMRADAAAKCAHYHSVLASALRTYRGPTTGPTTCGPRRRRPQSGGLSISVI